MAKLTLFLRFSRYLLPHWPKVLGSLGCSGVASLLALVSPVITKIMLDTVFPQKDVSLLILLILAGIALRLVGSGNSLLDAYFTNRTNVAVTYALRTDFYRHLQKLSLSFLIRGEPANICSG